MAGEVETWAISGLFKVESEGLEGLCLIGSREQCNYTEEKAARGPEWTSRSW